jgi:hypothetical protein
MWLFDNTSSVLRMINILEEHVIVQFLSFGRLENILFKNDLIQNPSYTHIGTNKTTKIIPSKTTSDLDIFSRSATLMTSTEP